jgi:hypothetical protein
VSIQSESQDLNCGVQNLTSEKIFAKQLRTTIRTTSILDGIVLSSVQTISRESGFKKAPMDFWEKFNLFPEPSM